MSTIRDVARATGFSTATVSHVINGRTERVGVETRARILSAIRELKYRPPAMEQGQKALLTRNIGVMASDLTKSPLLSSNHGYFLHVLDGIFESVFFRGFTATVSAERVWDDTGGSVRRSYDGRCDGVIFIAPTVDNPLVLSLQERGTPIVLVGTTAQIPDVSSVDVDNWAIGHAAAQHLVNLGHKTLAYIGRDELTRSSVEREAGFRAALGEAQIPRENYQKLLARDFSGREVDVVNAILSLPLSERPTGIMCWNDGMAADMIRLLRASGAHIPDDFSIIGVDNCPGAREYFPGLTTFPQSLQAMGRRAANLLLDKLGEGHQPAEVVKFNSEMIVRESTAPPPANPRIFPSIDTLTNGGRHEPKQSIHAY